MHDLTETACPGGCGETVFATAARSGAARCAACTMAAVGLSAAEIDQARASRPAQWLSRSNPPPPPAVYPPGGGGIRLFAPEDPDTAFTCLTCRERWPMVIGCTPVQAVSAFAGHDRVAHDPHAWLIGRAGGANHMICAPCGGGDRTKHALPGGPDHSRCLRGSRGPGGRCECAHRTRAQLDAIAGHIRRWSDADVQAVASAAAESRYRQLTIDGGEQ